MKAKSPPEIFELPVETDCGQFLARYSHSGLAGLDFPQNTTRRRREIKADIPSQVQKWHRATIAALRQTLAGKARPQMPPIDLSSGTDFQRRVWVALQKIECRQTRSYAEIARAIGNPRAARAVGGACGANPIPVLIPCHRVLAAHGKPGGFSSGLKWKRVLLAVEGVAI